MKNCRKCDSNDLIYVTNYEHLDHESEDYIESDGFLCQECECLHLLDGSYQYYPQSIWSTNLTKASYE